MKKISKILVAIIVSLTMLLSTACGGGGGDKAASPYEGKWIAVVAEMFGVQTSVEEVLGGSFSFEFNAGGKAIMSQGEESFKVKWELKEGNIVVNIDGEEVVGIVENIDTIVFDDMLGMGIKMTFGREGTEAADPTNYVSEEDKVVIGSWQSETITDVLGDEVNLDDVCEIHDALRFYFSKDHTVEVTYLGESIGSFDWESTLGYVSIETGEDFSIYITMNEDGTMSADYTDDEDYYRFEMDKVTLD